MNNLSLLKEVFVSNQNTRRQIHKLLMAGKIRKLASKLYTKNLKDKPEDIIKRYLWQIIGEIFPWSIICDRTSIENRPDKSGNIYLISDKIHKVSLPGNITIHPRKGNGPISSDKPFIQNLYLPSLARSLLENMKPSRSIKGELPRTLSASEMEKKLFEILLQKGDLNTMRDQAKVISAELGLDKEFVKLDKLIGTFLGTKSTNLSSKLGSAFLENLPYDEKRLELFTGFHSYLRNLAPFSRVAIYNNGEWRNLSFFESYFSNFIEGTEFAVEEAKKIIFDEQIPIERPEDAHDILGTYNVVSSLDEMSKIPNSYEELIDLLQKRHSVIMGGRPKNNPGEFKTKVNRAGSTLFVDPQLVRGTFKESFGLYQSLECPFYRAIFIKFLITEIHPFSDGNGRLSRIMMNAELVHAKEVKIIIPTVYRSNYLSALKALSQNNIHEPLVRCLDFAQKYVRSINWENFEEAQIALNNSNAFIDSLEADEMGIRLKII